MSTDDDGLIAASEAAMMSREGLAELWKRKAALEAEGRWVAVHACSDLIVGLSADHRVDLVRAEELARELVAELPDQRHFWLLANVLDAQGRTQEAIDAREAGAKVANMHPKQPEHIRKQLMAEAIAAQSEKPLLD